MDRGPLYRHDRRGQMGRVSRAKYAAHGERRGGTAQRVAASLGLFRASFAAYILEAACDITLNVLLYALLRPVSRNLALLATCFGLMATSVYAPGEMSYFAAELPAVDAGVARVISPEAKRRRSPIFASRFTGTSTGFSPYSMAPRR